MLPDDTWTVTFVSGAGANGFQEAAGAHPALDGTNTGGPAVDFAIDDFDGSLGGVYVG